ncbi:putative prophage protein [Escherichia coli]|uniref:Prophage protein n=1 Tax=Escherichia coli TaxID=562 RepID=A0AAX2KLR6_ECOLX|nr:putative prophage protein [Escherichia coli]
MSQGNGDGAAKCRISTCLINDRKIEPCAALAQSLEQDAEYTDAKRSAEIQIYNHELIHSQDLIMLPVW